MERGELRNAIDMIGKPQRGNKSILVNKPQSQGATETLIRTEYKIYTPESLEYFEQRMKELLDGMIETLDKALEDACPE